MCVPAGIWAQRCFLIIIITWFPGVKVVRVLSVSRVPLRPQTWQNNMTKTSDPKVKLFDGDDFTCVTFQPDLSKFKMEKLDKDTMALLTRRAYDVAGSCKGVKVTLNGKKLPVSVSSVSPSVPVRLGFKHVVMAVGHQRSTASAATWTST